MTEPIYFKTDLRALADRIIGIQEDLPDEDDRAALGEAAHWLRKFADIYNQQAGK